MKDKKKDTAEKKDDKTENTEIEDVTIEEGEDEEEDQYGYDWCLENYDQEECFDYYYGYKWCLEYYDDDECYNYYYPEDEFEWTPETNYKWCLNFYLPDDCESRYYSEDVSEAIGDEEPESNNKKMIGIGLAVLGVAGAGYGVYYWMNKRSKDYS